MEEHGIWREYIKLNLLGTSSYGTVYKARSKKDHKIVAIKEYSKFQKGSKEVYPNEMKYLDLLKSEYIIYYIHKTETEDNWYIIRDYYWGTLEEFTKMHPRGVPPKEIQKILLDLSNSFRLLNQKQLINKDIKPSNILLSFDGKNGYKAILSGIHLTQPLGEEDNSQPRGMRYICPPEGLKGEKMDMKYDVWSVGILIYFMVLRKYPFEGKRDMVILNQIEKGVNMDISDDADLNDLLKKTLQIDVSKRISWNDFFNHPFLKKEFNLKKKKKNIGINEMSEQISQLKRDYEETKRISQCVRDYGNIIKPHVDERIDKDYQNYVSKKMREIYSKFDEILKNLN